MTRRTAHTMWLPGTAAFGLVVALGIASCRDQTTQPDATASPDHSGVTESPQSARNPYAHVGRQHNDALDRVLQALQLAAQRQGPLTKADALRIAEATLRSLHGEQSPGRNRFTSLRGWDEILRERPGASARQLGASLSLESVGAGATQISVSSRTWEYLNHILYLSDVAGSVLELQQALASLENSARGELAFQDLEAVYVVSSVAGSSAEYWDANYDAWRAMCTTSPELCTGVEVPLSVSSDGEIISARINGWKVLAADVVGGIAGFMRGGVPGAVIGAAAASTSSIIGQM